jgi:bis(5'-nucleosyl)-tetraphosphatase (symmetrical)
LRWVIGDIHGCVKSFQKLLEKIRFDPASDELWSAGDLVGRGPDPVGVVRLLREMGGRAVMGNHEYGTVMTWAGLREKKPSRPNPLFEDPKAKKRIRWMAKLPYLAHLPGDSERPDTWIVHGGIHPKWNNLKKVYDRLGSMKREAKRLSRGELLKDGSWITDQDLLFGVFARCCTRNGDRSSFSGHPDDCPTEFHPWDDFYGGDDIVVHGHWGMRGYYRNGNVIGLDSGCVYGGKLTAWCHEEDRIVQVRSVDT